MMKIEEPDPHPDPSVKGSDPRIRTILACSHKYIFQQSEMQLEIVADPHQNVMDPQHRKK
jgi:hypothetical protein